MKILFQSIRLFLASALYLIGCTYLAGMTLEEMDTLKCQQFFSVVAHVFKEQSLFQSYTEILNSYAQPSLESKDLYEKGIKFVCNNWHLIHCLPIIPANSLDLKDDNGLINGHLFAAFHIWRYLIEESGSDETILYDYVSSVLYFYQYIAALSLSSCAPNYCYSVIKRGRNIKIPQSTLG